MYKPISHMRGAPVSRAASANDSKIRWRFIDDEGREWSGVGVVESAPEDEQAINTWKWSLQLMRYSCLKDQYGNQANRSGQPSGKRKIDEVTRNHQQRLKINGFR